MKSILYLTIVFFLVVSFDNSHENKQNRSNFIVSASAVNDKIVLSVKSVMFYPNTGYKITYREKVLKNEIFIEFENINAPSRGGTAFAPARCYIDLGKLKHGEYNITFEHNKKKTNGKLIVGTKIELTLDSASNVKLK
jgi:hypothetical protein